MGEEELRLRTLPPGIDGNHTGTLTICFQQCSVPNSVAAIQFWGGVEFNVAPDASIDYILVGERSTIATYLRDASPLHIKILTTDSVLIGNVFIPDLSLPAHSLDCKRSSKGVISLRQKIIGDATFELRFRLTPAQVQQPFEINELLEHANDSECQDSELCGSVTQAKYSLISELLDICSDDMTIPTVDTSIVAATGVDPYDSWISNIISSAASPPVSSTQGNEAVTVCEQPKENAAAAAASEAFPHPISLFLSNVATAAKASQLRSCSTTQPEARVERSQSTAVPPKLEPMQPPPIWIDVAVYCISNLQIAVTGSPPSCLELNLMCNEPLLSLCDLVQSSALRGDERSKCSSENVKTVEMPDECKELVSLPTQISWQAGLKTLNDDLEITLQIRYHCNDEKVIVGNVPIPLQMLGGSDTLGLLPRFEANGWFDVLDLINNSCASIGRIQLSLASGTLKQIRNLPKAHMCAVAIQRCWRERRSSVCCSAFVGKENEATKSDEGLSERTLNSLQNECDAYDDDTVNSHPPPPPDNSDDDSEKPMKQLHAETSPDSLFEEWSQQSFLHVDADEVKGIDNENATRAVEDEVGLAVDLASAAPTNVDADVRAKTRMDEGGSERNATFNPNPNMKNSAFDEAELTDPCRSSHFQLDSHHHSASSDDEATPPQLRQPIDPPEEYDVPNIKRKMDQSPSSSVRDDAKRHRTTNNSPSDSQVPLPPDLNAGATANMPIDEGDNFDGDCRSLQSVMNSLADVEERLKCRNSSNTPPTSVIGRHSDVSMSADVAVDDRSDVTLHSTQSVKSSVSQPPPEMGSSTKAAAVETCEKGTSPLCVPSHCKDASTSPCEEDGRNEVKYNREEKDGGLINVRDNENDDDRSKLQLDWSLNNLTRNNSTQEQGLFSTLRTSSDRRERYCTLFNAQSPYPNSASRLSSWLSPNGGPPRIEATGIDSSGYRRYPFGRRKPPDERVSSRAPSLNFTSANSDRIEQIFSGNNNKKKD
eukprot:scaffold1134_cov147-Skeletonema_menzelii.AAC.5